MSDSKLLDKLNKFYTEGTEADSEIYAEMRSNVLLVSGEHFNQKQSPWMQSVRDSKVIPEDQKIRIMKNHIGRIQNAYVNRLLKQAPTATILPRNDKEQQDLKSAELHNSVLEFIKDEYRLSEIIPQLADDYITFGEAWIRSRWDWTKGKLKNVIENNQEVPNEDGGMDVVEGDKEYEFTGALVNERIFGFNVFRPKGCTSFEDAEWIGIRSMVNREELVDTYKDKHENLDKKLEEGAEVTYLVFDNAKTDYREDKTSVLVKDIYYKPSPKYPNGYFYRFTKGVMLDEGELPFGIFPITFCGHSEIVTTPRFRSPIKQWKPFQREINRMSSKMAEHQVTLGDDKVLLFNGGKLAPGGAAPGVRGVSVNGNNAQVISGRTGEQYLPVLNEMITELYQVAMVDEEINGKLPAQIDPYALLISTSKWRERFSRQIEKFEKFVCKVSEKCLEITRNYIEEDTLVMIVGRHEQVNISEFKNSQRLCYQIKAKPSSDDVNDIVGKKMSLDRLLQYAGGQLEKDDIGKVMRLDPYLGKEQIFADFTMAYDNAVNDILAMDRGQFPVISKYRYKDPGYAVQRFSNRMGQADFSNLSPQVQNIYAQVLAQYEQMITQMAQEQKALESEFIPVSGPLVRTDMWIPDPKDATKQTRASFPADALRWLEQTMNAQGSTREMLAVQQKGVVSDIANQMRMNQQQMQAQQPQRAQPLQDAPPQAQQLMMMLQKAKAGQA